MDIIIYVYLETLERSVDGSQVATYSSVIDQPTTNDLVVSCARRPEVGRVIGDL